MADPRIRDALKEGLAVSVHKQFTGTVKAFDEAARTAKFVISTGSVDRDNDTINPAGWNLAAFKSNPVVLWAHNASLPPIGKAIDIGTRGAGRNKRLVATAQFATATQHELADTVFQLIVGGFLNATSVGFQPTEAEWNDERGGVDFLKQDLHEFSIVPVPANPDAVMTAAKEAGIDIKPIIKWAEYTLDHYRSKETDVLYKLVKAPVSQVDVSDLPEEVATVIEMVSLGLPGVKDALSHAVSEDADTIATFESEGDAIDPVPQADGDGTPLTDAELEDAELEDAELDTSPSDTLDIVSAEPTPSIPSAVLDMDPEELRRALQTEVKLQVAAVSGKLPD